MTNFSELIANVVSDLYQGGFIKDGDELQHFANLALDQTLLSDTRSESLKQIEMRCHMKWLGDFYLTHLSKKIGGESLKNLASQPKSISNRFDSMRRH